MALPLLAPLMSYLAANPTVAAAGIQGGTQLLGGAAKGIGAAMAGNPELDFAKDKEKRRQYEWMKELQLQKNQGERASNMSGFNFLASMRGNAEEKYKRMLARDQVLSKVNGGVA